MALICDRLNAVRQKTGLTNVSWAERSGVPVGTVARILSGATENPGIQTVIDLVTAAEVPLSDVFPGLPAPGEDFAPAPSVAALLEEKDARISALERLASSRARWLRLLAIIATSLVAVIVFLLIVDALSPNIGWFRG